MDGIDIGMEYRKENFGLDEHPGDGLCVGKICEPKCPLKEKPHRFPPYSLRSHIERNCDHRP